MQGACWISKQSGYPLFHLHCRVTIQDRWELVRMCLYEGTGVHGLPTKSEKAGIAMTYSGWIGVVGAIGMQIVITSWKVTRLEIDLKLRRISEYTR
ncbi:unnamed protein product [Larinioides sclopetarius]|uniref:Uncharacterized protein n=1 Tax=Larinioides sclopetarius TaxID=280406 RepID=A0AAV1Z6I0_9ARAC